jgi:tetraacyldisaccharide 4'-kinase
MRAPDFWRRNGMLPTVLSPLGMIWQARTTARIARTSPEKAGVPVICIGNAVAGGAGKTPVAIAVADSLMRREVTPHFLSRGYGGTQLGPVRVELGRHSAKDVGDEPLLLAMVAPTWVARERVAGATAAVSQGAGMIVMDDGFQNPSLFKDVSILVVDGGYGFGNRRVMPAGPLREPVEDALDRADAVAILGTDHQEIEKHIGGRKPVIVARFEPTLEDDDLSGMPVVAFAGIGRPAKFFETLSGMGCDLIATRSFPDHHNYTIDEIMRLVDAAAGAGAIVVTTEKDSVRLPEEASGMVRTLKVALEWRDRDALDKVVTMALQAKA